MKDYKFNKYKDYKNLFETIRKKSKYNYYNNELIKYKNNLKKTWNVMKDIIGKAKIQTNNLPRQIIRRDIIIKNPQEIAEEFNKFFINIGPELSSKIPNVQNNFENYLNYVNTSIESSEITAQELKNSFSSLKINKSSGYDDISSNVIKNIYEGIEGPLMHIFNLSIKDGIFPKKLKIAKVIPAFKTGDKSELSNYRPISILPCFSKILERIMYNRLINYLSENNLLFQKQFGFQASKSTDHAILELSDQIHDSFERNIFTLGIFIDLSKAFDTVNHQILLKKLEYYGIRNNSLKWFENYLHKRQQYLHADDITTNLQRIRCGVPQGSILGPLLFLIYVNDLNKSSTKLQPIMFADDTNLFYSHKNINVLFNTVNKELEKIDEWFKSNKLSLNVKKTNYIFFHKKTQRDNIPLKLPELVLDKKKINRVHCTKFLGVVLNEHLSWENHISIVENKISKNIGLLYKAKPYLSKTNLTSLYYSFIHCYINYANIAWASCPQSKLRKIYIKQKQASRIICGVNRYTHSRPLMQSLRILNVYQINILHYLIFMFKVNDNTVPDFFQEKFRKTNHKYPTAYSHNSFEVPKARSSMHFRLTRRGPSLWNHLLTNEEKDMTHLSSLKMKMKKKLLDSENELSFF